MDSSFWFYTIHLGWSIVYNGSHNLIPPPPHPQKKYCIHFSEDPFCLSKQCRPWDLGLHCLPKYRFSCFLSTKGLILKNFEHISFFSQIKCGIHKTLVWIANREDPDQTASWSGSALFVYAISAGKYCLNFFNIYCISTACVIQTKHFLMILTPTWRQKCLNILIPQSRTHILTRHTSISQAK